MQATTTTACALLLTFELSSRRPTRVVSSQPPDLLLNIWIIISSVFLGRTLKLQHGLEFRIHVVARATHSAKKLSRKKKSFVQLAKWSHKLLWRLPLLLTYTSATSNRFLRSHVKRVQINQFLNHKIEINQIDVNLSFTTKKKYKANSESRARRTVGVAVLADRKNWKLHTINQKTQRERERKKKEKSCKVHFCVE